MRVAVIAAGVGNVRSVVRALDRAIRGAAFPKEIQGTPPTPGGREAEIVLTRDPDDVRRADVLVAPGQGSFGAFARALEGGLGDAIREKVDAGTPYLGICLGLQILFERSEEAPDARGLGLLAGDVRRLTPGDDPRTGRPYPLPHIGYNRAILAGDPDIVASEHYYFAHSFAARPAASEVVLATADYGEPVVCAIRRGNVVGVQFHPEKSQRAGLALLERFFASLGGAR